LGKVECLEWFGYLLHDFRGCYNGRINLYYISQIAYDVRLPCIIRIFILPPLYLISASIQEISIYAYRPWVQEIKYPVVSDMNHILRSHVQNAAYTSIETIGLLHLTEIRGSGEYMGEEALYWCDLEINEFPCGI